MSMISSQVDRLRTAAQTYRNMGNYTAEGMLLDAADTIWELRGALQVASVDYRHLSDENAKLRTQLADVTESMGRVEERCAKLRELARGLGQCAQGVDCKDCLLYDLSEPDHCREERLSRELGIEV